MVKYLPLFLVLIMVSVTQAFPITVVLQGEIKAGVTFSQLKYQVDMLVFNYGAMHKRPDTIIVKICSGGGNVTESILIYEYLRDLHRMGYKIRTEASGVCASAAVTILQAGDVRAVGQHTVLMTHSPLYVIPSPVDSSIVIREEEFKEMREGLLRSQEQMIRIFMQRTKKPKHIVETWFTDKPRWWTDPTVAYQNGLVDEILYDNFDWNHQDMTTRASTEEIR